MKCAYTSYHSCSRKPVLKLPCQLYSVVMCMFTICVVVVVVYFRHLLSVLLFTSDICKLLSVLLFTSNICKLLLFTSEIFASQRLFALCVEKIMTTPFLGPSGEYIFSAF